MLEDLQKDVKSGKVGVRDAAEMYDQIAAEKAAKETKQKEAGNNNVSRKGTGSR